MQNIIKKTQGGTYRIAEAKSICAVSVCFEHELVFALTLHVIDLLVVRVENGDINVHVRATLDDSKSAVNRGALVHVFIKAFRLAWWQVECNGVTEPCRTDRSHEQEEI